MKKLLLGLLVAGACSGVFAEEFHFKIYNHSHYTVQLAQAATVNWNDKGGLDLVPFRTVRVDGNATELNIKDHNAGGSPDTDYFKLRVRDTSKNSKIPVYKYIHFGVINHVTGNDEFLIGADYHTQNKSVSTGDGNDHNIRIDIYDNEIRASDPGTFDEKISIKEALTPDDPSFDDVYGTVADALIGSKSPIVRSDEIGPILKNTYHFDSQIGTEVHSILQFIDPHTGKVIEDRLIPDKALQISNTDVDTKLTCENKSNNMYQSDSRGYYTEEDLANVVKENLPTSFYKHSDLFHNWNNDPFPLNMISSTEQINTSNTKIEPLALSDGIDKTYLNDDVRVEKNLTPREILIYEHFNDTNLNEGMPTVASNRGISTTSSNSLSNGWKATGSTKEKAEANLLFAKGGVELNVGLEYNGSFTSSNSCTETRSYTITLGPGTVIPPHTIARLIASVEQVKLSGTFTVERRAKNIRFHTENAFNKKVLQTSINNNLALTKAVNSQSNTSNAISSGKTANTKPGIFQTLRAFW